MKKILISAIVILSLLVIFTIVYNYQKSTPPPVSVIPLPRATSTSPSGDQITVPTANGAVIIADIRTLPEAKDSGLGMYHVEGTRSDLDAGFAILYSATDNSFSISIQKTPIGVYREKASQYFLELFKISRLDACKLKVLVGVPAEIDEKLSGKNLGLSFCPNSIT